MSNKMPKTLPKRMPIMINQHRVFGTRGDSRLWLPGLVFMTISAALWIALPIAVLRAESAIPLLSGFDEARIAGIFEGGKTQPNVAELAKLIFRVNKIDSASIEALAEDPSTATAPLQLAHVVMLKGNVRAVERMSVPESLAELLEFKQFYRVEIDAIAGAEPGDVASNASIYLMQIQVGLAPGDMISAASVVIGLDGGDDASKPSTAFAAARLRWTPSKSTSVGMKLLADEGVDISGVSSLASRNRQSLQSADGDAFYSMMAAASSVASKNVPQAESIRPVMLLQEPEEWIGDWIRLEVDTIRITMIAVTEPARQRQLGGDAYYQIDAIGDLGNVVIELQRPEGAPVRFENRFPVSIVMAKLPEFLVRKMQDDAGESLGVQMVSMRVAVDGFFFRLWSYENDRMSQDGQGEQIGPLVVASRMTSLEIPGSDPIGVSKIGYIAAGAVIIGLALAWLWTQTNRMSDTAAHASRSQRPAEDVTWLKDDIPNEDPGDRPSEEPKNEP